MITDAGFAALRRAATLVHSVPALRARLVFDRRVVVDVAPTGAPGGIAPTGAPREIAPTAVTPCRFRTAVADAWARHRCGQRFELCGLPPGAEPSIEIGVPPHGRTLPGDIHCVPLTERFLYVFATTFPAERCRERADHHLCDVPPPEGLWGIGLRTDPATEVTLVFAELAAEYLHRSETTTLELLEALVADIAVRQLLDDIEVTSG